MCVPISLLGGITRLTATPSIHPLITMSSAPEPPPQPPADNNSQKPDVPPQPETSSPAAQNAAEMDTTPDQPPEETWDDIPEEIKALTTEEILTRIRLIDNDIKVHCFVLFAK